MENQHLTYFKVENFKKFDSLEVKDIGQFNLIVGDNNVGKTCLLEALLSDSDDSSLLNSWINILKKRNLIKSENLNELLNSNYRSNEVIANKFTNLFKKNFLKFNKESISFYFKEDLSSRIKIGDKEDYWTTFFSKSFYKIIQNYVLSEKKVFNFPFIAFNSIFENDIFDLYNNLKSKKDKENLIKTIQVINNKIIDVELRQNFDDLENVFLLSFKDKDEFVPVNYLGDGFKRIFYIILKVLSLKGERIMIDEIETGIHHSRQKYFWINILKICNELNVQLFATTHSNECIQAFYEASKELNEQKDIRLISLQEGEKEKIYTTTYTFENIEAGLYSNIELRA
ncbi:AAA family ATPase [Epilithonimonas arachidiradicis]|uniref:AAA15 family ATPase/GTPase n=1 Tax=Epilithonimonas arachidiradicis TaxID=1617282 RepID=A0A420DA04_9FLAO|nr:AAA family ATPase [Epilithonimonas arachidiradicis]RKE87808.1 AAA15 family ATPase/GTPase [Epilithonimonas arachidiradicis]GGG58042.1 hypothetical protein GCM10007332_19740 [Epilithonimonas arachidiradicis]